MGGEYLWLSCSSGGDHSLILRVLVEEDVAPALLTIYVHFATALFRTIGNVHPEGMITRICQHCGWGGLNSYVRTIGKIHLSDDSSL